MFSGTKTKKKTLPLAEKLFEQGRSADEVANNILALMVGATVELSQSRFFLCLIVLVLSKLIHTCLMMISSCRPHQRRQCLPRRQEHAVVGSPQ